MRHCKLILRSLNGALLEFLVLTGAVQGAEPARQYTPDEILSALRERDPVIENYRHQFSRRETKRIDEQLEFAQSQFNNFKFGGTPVDPPASFPDPYDAVIVANVEMATRGDKLMIRSEWLTDHHGHPQLPRFNKVVDDGDLVREFYQGLHDTTLTIFLNQALYRAGNREQQMFYELALGVGFGRRIRTIDSVEATDSGWKLMGTFQLWTEDQTTFEMETDADLFVRKARLEANVRGNETAFDISTTGTMINDGRPAFAQQGSIKRTNVAFTRPDGERRVTDRVLYDYVIEASRLEFDLTDEQYARLSAIDATQADYVIDERPKN